jgi:hypothetical protein
MECGHGQKAGESIRSDWHEEDLRRSDSAAHVTMMETADFRQFDDRAHAGRVDGWKIRRVLPQR